MFNFHYSKYLILDLIFLYVPRPRGREGDSRDGTLRPGLRYFQQRRRCPRRWRRQQTEPSRSRARLADHKAEGGESRAACRYERRSRLLLVLVPGGAIRQRTWRDLHRSNVPRLTGRIASVEHRRESESARTKREQTQYQHSPTNLSNGYGGKA